jgi:DNA-binding CsgD family transcriptional regulator
MRSASVASLGSAAVAFRGETGPRPIEEGSDRSLVGRDHEMAWLDERLAEVAERGSALVIRGEAGVGKSALLGAAGRSAVERGMATIRVAGFPSEGHIPFAGLHQLLRPGLAAVGRLAAPQRSALLAAFGESETETPDFFFAALASLELLSEMAAAAPLLLVIDDAQWLDVATCDVLAFVARRLACEPIVLLFAVRDGVATRIDKIGLPDLHLQPLDHDASTVLLDANAPDLAVAVRRRVLAEALGNPLALLELPRAVVSEPGPAARSLQLTERLEGAFAARMLGLPQTTRSLLLVASLDEAGDLQGIMSAASKIEGRAVGQAEVSAAIAARVVTVGDNGLRFRHPLVRSAVQQGSTAFERQAAHEALASVYSRKDPDRAVWHRAAALTGPNDQVAAQLVLLAERAERRGATAVARSALERAARLTTENGRRGQLLLEAASLAYELGQLDIGARLLVDAQQVELTPDDQTMLLYLLELFGSDNTWPGATRVRSLVSIAENLQAVGRTDSALDALEIASARCWWSNPDQNARDLVVTAAERLRLPDDNPRLLSILAQADPVKRGALVLDRISHMTPDVADPKGMYLVGSAASAVWAYDLALGFLAPAVAGLRAQGRVGLLARALVAQAWAAVHLAREPLALSAAEEATFLAQETGQVQWAVSAQLATATIAAERGNLSVAEAAARAAEAQILPMGATPMLALAQFVRGRGAVAHQKYEEGFEHLRRTLDPADPAFHPFIGAWGLSDLVEAASHTGRNSQAEAYLQQLESLAADTAGPLLRATAGYARTMVADDESAEILYRQALERDLVNWPCYRGRMLLWYGRWLRRQRRATESRLPLRAALESFDALAFPELAKSARRELRSTGERPRPRTEETWTRLTPQELQIAQLAAAGHTNREIGQKLYLSHRTVEYHLHMIFPKLGITRRSHLRGTMSEEALS